MTGGGASTKRVTAADVAKSLGLSRATVGFVLNDTRGQTISEGTRKRVLAEAKRLGYRPHTAARALASGKSHIVLIVLPDWPVDYSLRAHLDEASLVLDRAGYSLVTMTPHPGGQAVPLWESLNPDVVMSLAPISDSHHEAILATGAKAMVPGRDDQGLGSELRFEDGPRLQVTHLIETGRRRLAFAGTADARLADLSSRRHDLADETCLSLTGDQIESSAAVDESNASAILADWLAAGVQGIVAYNDDVAAILLGAAVRGGRSVPADIAIVGHDDSPLARLTVPSLSSVRVDAAGLGRFLANLALSEATGSARPDVGPEATAELIRRESS